MVEEKGIRAKLALEIDEESIRRAAEDFMRHFKEMANVPFNVQGPSGGGGGPLEELVKATTEQKNVFEEVSNHLKNMAQFPEFVKQMSGESEYTLEGVGFDTEDITDTGPVTNYTLDDIISSTNKQLAVLESVDRGVAKMSGDSPMFDSDAMKHFTETSKGQSPASQVARDMSQSKDDGGSGGGLEAIAGLLKGGVMAMLTKVAVAASAILGIVKIIGAIFDAPLLKMVLQQFQMAFNLFFMPFGNFLGMALMPMTQKFMEFSVGWNKMVMEHGLVDALVKGLSIMGGWIWDAIPPWIQTILELVAKYLPIVVLFRTIEPYFPIIRDYLGQLWGAIELIGSVLNKATMDDIITAFETVLEAILSIGPIIMDALTGLWETIKTWWKDNITDPINDLADDIVTFATDIVSAITGLGATIKEHLMDTAIWLAKAFSSALAEVMNFTDNIWDTVSSVVPKWATGAVATSPTLGWVGDGNEPEVILPLSRAPDIIAETLDKASFENIRNTNQKYNINIDMSNSNIYGIQDLDMRINNGIQAAIRTATMR